MGNKDKHKDRRVEESDEEDCVEKINICSESCEEEILRREEEASKDEGAEINLDMGRPDFDQVNKIIEEFGRRWEQQNGPSVEVRESGGEKDCDAAEG